MFPIVRRRKRRRRIGDMNLWLGASGGNVIFLRVRRHGHVEFQCCVNGGGMKG